MGATGWPNSGSAGRLGDPIMNVTLFEPPSNTRLAPGHPLLKLKPIRIQSTATAGWRV